MAVDVDPSRAYRLHPNVAVRPEPFGALVYHYGNRKLVFLKSPRMVQVVRALNDSSSINDALDRSKVPAASRTNYLAALRSLYASDMIVADACQPAVHVETAAPSMTDSMTPATPANLEVPADAAAR